MFVIKSNIKCYRTGYQMVIISSEEVRFIYFVNSGKKLQYKLQMGN